jgi:DNA-binding GntR family transcriptional regulator
MPAIRQVEASFRPDNTSGTAGTDAGIGGAEVASRRAVRHLRDRILTGAVPPGSVIRQEAVARELDMSRIPIREALRQLEAEGLVILVPHGSARVPLLKLAEFSEIYKIREFLEPLAGSESASRISDAGIYDLRTLLAAIESAHPGAYLDADRRFHLASYAAAGMPRLLRMVENFWNLTQPYRRALLLTLITNEDSDGVSLVQAEHRLIVDAFSRRDSFEVERLVRSHIRRTRLRLDEHKELFT